MLAVCRQFYQLITVFIDSIVVAGGDQGLLNMYFSDWAHTDITKHLPFIYNVVSQAFYSYLPAFKQWVSVGQYVYGYSYRV